MQNVGFFFFFWKKRVTTFTYTSRTLGRQQTTNDIQQEERLSQRIKGIFSHKLYIYIYIYIFFFLKLRLGDINCCQMIYYLCIKK